MTLINQPTFVSTKANSFAIDRLEYFRAHNDINVLSSLCHGASRAAGWWDNERNVGEMLCLIHSEISEAMEGHRKGLMDDKLPHHPMIAVELADALIRIFDMAGGLGLDLGLAFAQKLQFNQTRPDHTRQARAEPGGKSY